MVPEKESEREHKNRSKTRRENPEVEEEEFQTQETTIVENFTRKSKIRTGLTIICDDILFNLSS